MESKNDVQSPKLNDSNMDFVTQIIKERLNRRPIIANAKQEDFCGAMLDKTKDLGLRSNAVPRFEEYLKSNLQCHIEKEMSRVSKMAVLMLEIGSWKKKTQYKGHVMAKFLFYTRKMMWEIWENDVKNKIEIEWDDIVNMKVGLGLGSLELCMFQIELSSNRTPTFYQEINPQSRKHIINEITSDFTGGEAMHSRVHTLWFCKGDLDEHYERLLRYEPRFAQLNENALQNRQRQSDIGLKNVLFCCNQNNVTQMVTQKLNFQDGHVEQGKAEKRSLISSGGLTDILQESAAYNASKDMFPQKIQQIEPSFFEETPPKLEKHGQPLTHSADFEPFEPMIECSFPSSQNSLVFANLDDFGNDIIADCYGTDPSNNPYHYLHYLADATPNHENLTMVETPTPLSADKAGPTEASNTAAMSVDEQTWNFEEVKMESESIEEQSSYALLSTIQFQDDRNMNDHTEQFDEISTDGDIEDLIDVPSSFAIGYGSQIFNTNCQNKPN